MTCQRSLFAPFFACCEGSSPGQHWAPHRQAHFKNRGWGEKLLEGGKPYAGVLGEHGHADKWAREGAWRGRVQMRPRGPTCVRVRGGY